jgi:D-serine deaminase-like pyridoxal phosphate-dependent protein
MNLSASLDPGKAVSLIQRARDELPTPVMLLDLDVATRNIARMAERFTGSAKLRPHGKSHKCAELAELQLRAGAIGLTTATAWEAVAFAGRGVDDILVANEVVGADKIKCLAGAAREARITVAIDDAGNAADLARAATLAGSEIGVLIDVDVGMVRCGVRDVHEALRLAQAVTKLAGLKLRGVMGYEGHCVLEADRRVRAAKAHAAMERLLAVAAALTGAGFPVEVVSAGGTSTTDVTGQIAGVTEIQAGSYVLMDNARRTIVPDFQVAMTILTTVISRHGNTVVVDAGRKTVGLELALPTIVNMPATLRKSSDEHLVFELAEERPLRVGDRLDVIPGYVPTTVNLHDAFLVMRAGRCVDLWPVLARGAGCPWVA